MRFALLVVLVGCGRIGFDDRPPATALRATISAMPPLSFVELDARFAFATLDPDELHAIPAAGGAPALPLDAVFTLPDVSGDLMITVTARDARGRTIETTAMTPIEPFQEQPLALVLGDQLVAHCLDGSKDVDERDIDCGGSCPACGVGSVCASPADCATGTCTAFSCEPASGPPSWKPIADAPDPRIGGGAVLGADDRIYVVGGGPGDITAVGNVDVYDAATDTWSSGPALPTPRVRLTVTIDQNGKLYAIGGTGVSGITTLVETYVPGATTWATTADLPLARSAATAAVRLDGGVYVFGGHGAGANLDRTDGLSGGTWIPRATMLSKPSNLASARSADGSLFVIGGHDFASSVFYPNVASYQPSTDTWTMRPALAQPRSDLAAAVGADDRIYAIGGFAGATGLALVEALRPGATGWVSVPPLAFQRDACMASVGPDGRLFVFGGRVTTIAQASGEAYGPRLHLGADHGAAGAMITVTGDNFAPNASVRIYVGAVAVELAHTDGTGALPSTSIRIPPIAAGTSRVRAIDDHSLYPVTARFTIP